MLTNKELTRIVQQFDEILQDQPKSTQQREALAHRIDDFIKRYSEKIPTPPVRLKEARDALSKCNLPLTKFIFEQESRLAMARYDQDVPVEVSPSVAISIVSEKKKYRTLPTQFDSIDHDKPKRLVKKMIESLQMIRDDLQKIAEKYQRHKEKQRRIRFILDQINSYDPLY